ncbi:MAG: hypothetical protein ACFB0C_15000 [Leptolyngbyaceae cyanobacterium]
MTLDSRYWTLLRLDSAGRCGRQQIAAARTWLHHQLDQGALPLDEEDTLLQNWLLQRWRVRGKSEAEDSTMALLCLRCYVSHGIYRACQQLAQQFGSTYQFRSEDLYPYGLDDDGRPLGAYQPLTVHILERYQQGRNRLESWAMHVTRNHTELNQFLLEKGVYRATDWSILNDTTVEQVARILGEFHGLSNAEVTAAQTRLTAYHRVYRQDRFQQRRQGKGGRCAIPTEAQLSRMDATQPPAKVLAHLQDLAHWLRQYRIHVRGGLPAADSLDALPGVEPVASDQSELETAEADFLETYHQQFQTQLTAAVETVIEQYCTKFRKRSPKDQQFLKALALFHCEGESLGAIAPQIGLKDQVQVTRLLDLKRLRSDVRDVLLPRLQTAIQAEVLTVTSAERLEAIADVLNHWLTAAVDELVAEAKSEAQSPQKRRPRSRLARQLCKSAHGFSPELS